MDKKKQLLLEKAGFRVGGIEDFLNLSAEEVEYIEVKMALSNELADKRKAMHLTQEDLAKKLHSSQSRVAKMESGNDTVSLDLLIRSLIAIGATKLDLSKAIKNS